MPIRYRRFYIQKLIETHEKQQEEIDKRLNKNTNSLESTKVKPPSLPIPDFATKVRAPKK